MTWEDVNGWMFDFRTIYDQAVFTARPGAVFVEVGCWVGRSLIYLATEAKKKNVGIHVWAVDNWKGAPCDGLDRTCREKEAAGLSLFEEFRGNCVNCGVWDFINCFKPGEVPDPVSSMAADRFRDKSLDLVFIDADHSYEAVKRDVLAWYPKVREGGVLAGHDSNRAEVQNGVKDALDQLKAPGKMVIPPEADWSWRFEPD